MFGHQRQVRDPGRQAGLFGDPPFEESRRVHGDVKQVALRIASHEVALHS